MKRLGFVGTGAITCAIVKGMPKSALKDWPIAVSPRSRDRAETLAAAIPSVSVAADNQSAVDASDIVFLAIRPQIAVEVISALRFHSGQVIISLVAGMAIETVKSIVPPGIPVIRAIPLPSVEACACATPVMPPHADATTIFNALGSAISVTDEAQFDGYVAGSAVMATYFGIVKAAADWMVANGVAEADADGYFRTLFGNLGDIMRQRPGHSLDQLREEHTTKGGLNEMVHEIFLDEGGATALCKGLDAVLARIRA